MTPTALLLGLAWFGAVNVVVSALSWGAAVLMLRRREPARQSILLAIRLAPAAVSVAFVLTLFLPAHWRFEPVDARESFGAVLFVLAALGGAVILRSLARAVAVARAGWGLRACRALERIDRAPRAYEVPGLAGVSLAGVFRTRVLVGAQVRHLLSDAELGVALAHEIAHRRALDNVKRCLVFCAPDVFSGSKVARRIDEQWRAAAEWLADARAADGDAARALNLASALVKVSRMAAPDRRRQLTSPAWSTLHDEVLLAARVRRLVAPEAPSAGDPRVGAAAAAAACMVAVLAAFAAMPWASVHHVTETLVRILP